MHEEELNSMLDLRLKLVAAVISGLLAVGAVAQKQDGDKRPPKETPKVVVQPKDRGERPPKGNNNNNNQGGKKEDKKGRP
jgi:hypothetical protein